MPIFRQRDPTERRTVKVPVVTSTSVYPPDGYPEPKKCPYTFTYETEKDVECITALAPKPVDFFPDCVKYPPPKGTKDIINGRGCLMTSWQDVVQGNILLETIWQPIYDTQEVLNNKGVVTFFANPAGKSAQHSNLPTAGQLTWPKRFHVWQIEFTFENDDIAQVWARVPGKSPIVSFRIGEKNHFTVPLSTFYKVPTRTNTYCAPLPSPLYLPPVQNFGVELRYEGDDRCTHAEVSAVRCALNGYLHREIP